MFAGDTKMENTTSFNNLETGLSAGTYADPIISMVDVKWAARRFILVYGEEAPEMALRQVDRLDQLGKLRVAEMFERIRRECARLLQRSESLRIYPVN
tara:strand:- start:435 stop:728 length:294 start_codon:yes stop_codon:yes gene_type:complete